MCANIYLASKRGEAPRPREHEMTRISKKDCNDMADLIGATFYARNEWDCSGKVYVRLNGKRHAFRRNCDALDWMMDILDGKVDKLAAELGF